MQPIEQHQQTLVNWLPSPGASILETTLNLEQLGIEMTCEVAQRQPELYPAQVNRFGMLEDFDHRYRFAALLERPGQGCPPLLRSTATSHRHAPHLFITPEERCQAPFRDEE